MGVIKAWAVPLEKGGVRLDSTKDGGEGCGQ